MWLQTHDVVFKGTIRVNEVSDTRFVSRWRDRFCSPADGDDDFHLAWLLHADKLTAAELMVHKRETEF